MPTVKTTVPEGFVPGIKGGTVIRFQVPNGKENDHEFIEQAAREYLNQQKYSAAPGPPKVDASHIKTVEGVTPEEAGKAWTMPVGNPLIDMGREAILRGYKNPVEELHGSATERMFGGLKEAFINPVTLGQAAGRIFFKSPLLGGLIGGLIPTGQRLYNKQIGWQDIPSDIQGNLESIISDPIEKWRNEDYAGLIGNILGTAALASPKVVEGIAGGTKGAVTGIRNIDPAVVKSRAAAGAKLGATVGGVGGSMHGGASGGAQGAAVGSIVGGGAGGATGIIPPIVRGIYEGAKTGFNEAPWSPFSTPAAPEQPVSEAIAPANKTPATAPAKPKVTTKPAPTPNPAATPLPNTPGPNVAQPPVQPAIAPQVPVPQAAAPQVAPTPVPQPAPIPQPAIAPQPPTPAPPVAAPPIAAPSPTPGPVISPEPVTAAPAAPPVIGPTPDVTVPAAPTTPKLLGPRPATVSAPKLGRPKIQSHGKLDLKPVKPPKGAIKEEEPEVSIGPSEAAAPEAPIPESKPIIEPPKAETLSEAPKDYNLQPSKSDHADFDVYDKEGNYKGSIFQSVVTKKWHAITEGNQATNAFKNASEAADSVVKQGIVKPKTETPKTEIPAPKLESLADTPTQELEKKVGEKVKKAATAVTQKAQETEEKLTPTHLDLATTESSKQPPTEGAVTEPGEAKPKMQGAAPKAASEKLTWSKMQAFAETRKAGFTADQAAQHLGYPVDEVKGVLQELIDEKVMHNVRGNYKPGPGPVKVNPPTKKTETIKPESPVVKALEEKETKATPEATAATASRRANIKVYTPEQQKMLVRRAKLQNQDSFTDAEATELEDLNAKIEGFKKPAQPTEESIARDREIRGKRFDELDKKQHITMHQLQEHDKLAEDLGRPKIKNWISMEDIGNFKKQLPEGTKLSTAGAILEYKNLKMEPSKFGSGPYRPSKPMTEAEYELIRKQVGPEKFDKLIEDLRAKKR